MAETGVFIKFDPEKLAEISVKLEQYYKQFIQHTESIRKKSEAMIGIWQGDSANLYISKVKELDAQRNESADVLLSFSRKLAEASGIYKTGETDAKIIAESLPTDGVFRV